MSDRPEKLAGAVGLLARGCARYRWLVVVAWLALIVPTVLYLRDGGARYVQEVAPAGSESARALDRVAAVTPGGRLSDIETIVLRARRGNVDNPPARDGMAALIAEVGKLPGVAVVADPSGPLGAAALGIKPISADRRTALVAVLMKGDALKPDLGAVRRVIDVARAYDGPALQVEVSGPGATMIGTTGISPGPLIFAALAAVILLGATLRSRPGILVCLTSGAVAALLAVAATSWLSHMTVMASFAPIVAGVLAFGSCLGGAVVVVHRAQSALLRGEDRVQATVSATATSGAAVAVGGLGLTIAMLAVSGLGLSGFDAVAPAAAAAGVTTVLVILTLVPALLAAGGVGLLDWAERRYLVTVGAGLGRRPGLRSWWAGQVGRYPAVVALAAGVLLVGLASQAGGLRLGGGDAGADPTSMTTRRAYDLISQGFFAGVNGPILVAVNRGTGPQPGAAKVAAPGDIAATLAAVPGVRSAAVSLDDTARGLAIVRVLPEAGPQTQQASDLIGTLRHHVLPVALRGSVSTADVGGPTALFDDAAKDFRSTLPAFLAIVLATVGLVTFLVARSAALAAVLGAAGTLSMLASAGVLRILFQDERFTERLGVTTSPIEPFVLAPVMIVVFGLAPGMNLILLGRLREGTGTDPGRHANNRGPARGPSQTRGRARRGWPQGGRDSIRSGHADLGHVVLTMNMVMAFVFLAIATQPPRTLKMMGYGLAAGLVVDALVLRVAVLPASVHLRHVGQGHHVTRRRGHSIAADIREADTATVPLSVCRSPGRHSSRPHRASHTPSKHRPPTGPSPIVTRNRDHYRYHILP